MGDCSKNMKTDAEAPRLESEVGRSPYAKSRTSGSCVYRIYYSFIFYARGRKPILTDPLSSRLKEFVGNICEKYEYELVSFNQKDNQVTVILGAKPINNPSDIVGNLKRGVAHLAFEAFPELESQLGKRSLWAEGYLVDTINWRQLESIVAARGGGGQTTKSPLKNAQVEALVDKLPLPHREVVGLLYGLKGEKPRTHEQVALALGMTHEEVVNAERAGLAKLKAWAKNGPSHD